MREYFVLLWLNDYTDTESKDTKCNDIDEDTYSAQWRPAEFM